jgi:hypothetical protein
MSMVVAELFVINFSAVIVLQSHVFPLLSTIELSDLPRSLWLILLNLMMGVAELIVIYPSTVIVLW